VGDGSGHSALIVLREVAHHATLKVNHLSTIKGRRETANEEQPKYQKRLVFMFAGGNCVGGLQSYSAAR
jgi:hypothetical protein